MASQSYLELRRQLGGRDRSLHEKVISLEEAAALVTDGATVGIGGSTLSRTPMAMIWALIRARRKRLTCARGITSSEGDLALRVRRLRSHRDELVQPRHRVGRVESDAPLRRERQGAL